MASTAKALKRESEERNKEKVRIYNPDSEDFTVRLADKSYTIRSLEIELFNYRVANHMKKHLATHLLNKRGRKDGLNVNDSLEEIKKEIEVK